MAGKRLVSLQCGFFGAGTAADPPLPAPRPGATRTALPTARDHAGGHREQEALDAARAPSLGRAGVAQIHNARRSERARVLETRIRVAPLGLHESSEAAARAD